MFKKSFQLFFVVPLNNLYSSIKEYLKFLILFFKENLLLNFEPKKDDEDLKISSKIFQIIVIIIIANLSVEEITKNKESNLLTEIGQEILIAFVYWFFYIVIYYFGVIFNKILKTDILATFSVKMWNFYALLLIVISLLTNNLSSEPNTDLLLNLWLFISIHLLLYFIKLTKRGLFIKKYLLYIFLLSILLMLEITFFSAFCNSPFIKK